MSNYDSEKADNRCFLSCSIIRGCLILCAVHQQNWFEALKERGSIALFFTRFELSRSFSHNLLMVSLSSVSCQCFIVKPWLYHVFSSCTLKTVSGVCLSCVIIIKPSLAVFADPSLVGITVACSDFPHASMRHVN